MITKELIVKFNIPDDIAEYMAGIYSAYIEGGHATIADCQHALLTSMAMLDLNHIDEAVNRAGHNDAYYVAREIVRLPFDGDFMDYAGNSLNKGLRIKLSTAEFLR